MGREATENGIARFGAFEADLANFELRKGGLRIKLQAQPFRMLAVLIRNYGEVVPREELRKEIWDGDTFVEFEHGINTAMQKVRRALNDSARNPRFIETLPRRGYRFVAPVEFKARKSRRGNGPRSRWRWLGTFLGLTAFIDKGADFLLRVRQ